MNIRRSFLPVLLLAFAGVLGAATHAAEPTAFDEAFAEYEKIRLALLDDSTDGVAEAARALHAIVATSEDGVHRAVPQEQRAAAGELFADAAAASLKIAAAADLASARAAFADVSEALIRYRQLLPDPTPVVAFCPMVKKAWLQPDGEIGNPYHGRSMPRCGEIVSR